MGSWWEPGSSETFVCVSTLSKMKRKAVVIIMGIDSLLIYRSYLIEPRCDTVGSSAHDDARVARQVSWTQDVMFAGSQQSQDLSFYFSQSRRGQCSGQCEL